MKNLEKINKQSGFSFVEGLITVVIFSIVATASSPMLTAALDDSKLSGAASEVVNALQFAKLTAINSGKGTIVMVDADMEMIGVGKAKVATDLFNSGDVMSDISIESEFYDIMEYPLKKGTQYIIRLREQNRFNGVDITASSFNQGEELYFNNQGYPSSGGTVSLTCGSLQVNVNVAALTGKITVSHPTKDG